MAQFSRTLSGVGRAALAAAAAGALTGAARPAPVPAAELADVSIRPDAAGGTISGLVVRETFSQGDPAAFQLSIPVVFPGAPGTADRISDLALRDAEGPVKFTVSEDTAVPGGFPYYRHFTPGRTIRFPVIVTYRAATVGSGLPGGPAFAMRSIDGAVAGAGATFLILPDTEATGRITLRWDLAGLPTGAIASSSYGDGDHSFVGKVSSLAYSWYVVGAAGHMPLRAGFGASWIGRPTYDVRASLTTAREAYRYLGRTFPHLRPTPEYRVFVQFRTDPPFGGGTALEHSFMLSQAPPKQGVAGQMPLSVVFHEMIHQWTGQIEGPTGITSWFSEGLTSYYEHRLPTRGGFLGLDEFGKAINTVTYDYMTGKARNWSAEAIVKVGFGEEQVRHMPYRRSELYFHDLDARIREKSGGRRNLDSLLFPLFLAREKGMPFTEAKWIELVSNELGPDEGVRFRRLIIEGVDTLSPHPNSFGPCFRPQPTVLSRDGIDTQGLVWRRVPGLSDRQCRKTI